MLPRKLPDGLTKLDLFYIWLWFAWLTLWGYTEITERIDDSNFKKEFKEFHDKGPRWTEDQAREQNAILEKRIEQLENRDE